MVLPVLLPLLLLMIGGAVGGGGAVVVSVVLDWRCRLLPPCIRQIIRNS
jgi:hypothetical protein